VREEGRIAAAASIAAAAREQELEAELEASRANHAALEKRLTRTSDELSVLQGASRSAELEAHWLRQQEELKRLGPGLQLTIYAWKKVSGVTCRWLVLSLGYG
jgi:chromosome condensin MukBEF ATPase and DNA-binding subunit MukB